MSYKLVVSLLLLHTSCDALQKLAAPAPEWRRDAVKFREELTRYQTNATGDKQFPKTSFDFFLKGGAVPREWEVMRLYAGEIEWEGIFEGFDTSEGIAGRTKRIKVQNYGMALHLYPAESSLKSWENLSAGSKVRYRGMVEGIAGFPVPGKEKGIVMMVVSVKDTVLLPGK